MHFYALTVRTLHGIHLKQVGMAPLDLYQTATGCCTNPQGESGVA